jgi:hypothetical protein
MKDCKDCKYFNGYDYDDGTPECDYEGGYEACPYCCEGDVEKDKCKITLDMPDITTFIKHTVANTVHKAVYDMIDICVKSMVKDKIEDIAEAYVKESLKKVVDDEIKAYMQKEITIGGGWREPERKPSRNEYLAECTAKVIDEKLNPEKVADIVRNYCQRTIDDNVASIKVAVNTGIKTQFDETTRKALSDNVVSMLMAGNTYKRLSDSMERILK